MRNTIPVGDNLKKNSFFLYICDIMKRSITEILTGHIVT